MEMLKHYFRDHPLPSTVLVKFCLVMSFGCTICVCFESHFLYVFTIAFLFFFENVTFCSLAGDVCKGDTVLFTQKVYKK